MNKLITSFISSTAQQPIEKITLDHIQGAYTEALAQIVTGMIGPSYDPAKVYVLYGCVASTPLGSLITNISAGALFANGEIFYSPAQSASFAASLPGAVMVAIVGPSAPANFVDTDSPSGTQFSDGSFHQVHSVRQVLFSYSASGSGNLNGGASVNNDYGNFVTIQQDFNLNGVTLPPVDGFPTTHSIDLGVKKIDNNQVVLSGSISTYSTTIPGSMIFAVFPADKCPIIDVTLLAWIDRGVIGTSGPDKITIDTSGNLIYNNTGASAITINLTGLSYRIA